MKKCVPNLSKLKNLNGRTSASSFIETADMQCDVLEIISEWEAAGISFVLENGEKMFSTLEVLKYYKISDVEQRINWS